MTTYSNNYWECHCNYNDIKPVEITYCKKCNAWKEECPKAKDKDVQKVFNRRKMAK